MKTATNVKIKSLAIGAVVGQRRAKAPDHKFGAERP